MIIRQETTSDASAVYELVKTAFASAEHSDGNEQDLVVLLHKSPAFQPALSLVAEENEKIIGYILFSEIKIGKKQPSPLRRWQYCRNTNEKALGLPYWQKVTALPKNLATVSASYWAVKHITPKSAMCLPPVLASSAPLRVCLTKTIWHCLCRNLLGTGMA